MVPTSLKLSNFTSYGTPVPTLDFTKFHLAAISGENGAGKSSLLDAITWCLWGTSRLGDSSDQLIKLGQTHMEVEFSFELDNHIYTVKRTRSLKGGGSSSLEFSSGSHNLTEGTIKATQQKIIDTLHLTYETFTNSAFLRQGHADEFTTKGPTERKKILADILGLSHYDLLEERAKEKIKDIQASLKLLEYQALEIEAELSQKEERSEKKKVAEEKIAQVEENIKDLEEGLKSLRAQKETINLNSEQRKKLEENYLENKKELEKIITQGKNRKEKINLLQEQLKKLAGVQIQLKELKNLQEEKGKMDEIRQQKLEKEKQLLETQGFLNLKKQQEQQFKKEVEKLNSQLREAEKPGSKCPTCGQEIGKSEKAHVHQELFSQIKILEKQLSQINYKEEEASIQKLETILKSLIWDPFKYQQIVKKLDDLEKIQSQKEQGLQIEATLQAEQKVVLEMRVLFQNKKTQVDKLSEDLSKLPDLSSKLLEINQEITQTEQTLSQKRDEEKDIRGTLGQINELISRTSQMEKLQKQKSEEKNKLTRQKETFEELSLAFGKKGIQAMIIETAIPEIEEETNRLLSRLTDGRMQVIFETQRETKNKVAGEKGIIETLDIIISDETGERPYEGYSIDGAELVFIRENKQIKSLPIEDLWDESQFTNYDGEYQLQNTKIETLCYINGKAKWQKVDKMLRHKSPNKIFEVKAGPGNYTVKLTKNHSLYILTPEGIRVKATEDLKPGDFLLSPRIIPSGQSIKKIDFVNFISNEFLQQREINNKSLKFDREFIWSRLDQKMNRYIQLDQNFATLIGIIVAEGSGKTDYSIAAGTSSRLALDATIFASKAFGNNKRALGFISESRIRKYTQNSPGISSKNPQAQFQPKIGGRLVAEIMRNMVGSTAVMKKIPDFIFNTSRDIQLAFLKGLIAGDGHITSNKTCSKSEVCVTTISDRLAGEIVFLCRQLGIWARIENHGEAGFRRGMSHKKSYRIVISGKKNLEILGLGEIVSNYDTATKYEGIPYTLTGTRRKNSLRFPRDVENQIFTCGIQKIPHAAKADYLKIEKMAEDWNILEVKEVKKINPVSAYVYDLMVPHNNSFVAGSGAILVHNSGGEQFRVNFAIRLALSKLLTHRAGSKLQFLVIDEGFGTQDAQGRSKIVEALEVIKNDFEKILVITHLEELKEEFPVRIEVSKTPTGSTFEVIGA